MAVRRPLYYSGGNLRVLSESQVSDIISQVSYQYSLNPSVTLSVVGSGGTLGTLSDTRYKAGNYSTDVSSFPSEATTQEPQTVTTDYSRISESAASPGLPTGRFPMYYDGANLRAMTLTDMYDTFIYPAINILTSSSTSTAQGGTYRIHTGTSLAGHTLVSSTPVFIDTRWNTSAGFTIGDNSAGNVDQPTTITNFYLFSINGSAASYVPPVFSQVDGQLKQSQSVFDTILQSAVRYVAASDTGGYKIRYSYSSGNNRGSGMTDTKLNGSGNYQTNQVNGDDYRAQEFPNGTQTTISTNYLKINKA